MSLTDTLYQLTPSPGVLLLIIGIIALLESLAVVGLLIPGVVLITAAASLAGHQDLAIPAVLLAAFAGAVIGDGLSFALGYTQRERVPQLWPFRQHPEWLARGARFFQRYGSLSVFFGRFVGPVRPVIPLIAGMLQMSPRAFTWANVASALLWAPAYVLPGYLLGQTWQQLLDLPPGLEVWLIGLGLLVIALALAFSWLRYQVTRAGATYRGLARLAGRHPATRRLWLAMSRGERSEVPLASWLLLIVALATLSGLTIAVIRQDGPFAMDLVVTGLFAELSAGWLEAIAQALARIGDTYGILALILPWALWLLARRRLDALLHLGAGLGGIALLNTLGKALIGRPRPDTPDYLTGSLAYPSAHASTAVVLYGLAAAFIAQELPHRQRFWAYWAAIAAALPMALSRLVLGVHWFSDLIGGALLGLVVCALVRLAWLRRARPNLAPCPWAPLAAASLVLVAARVAWLPPV
ncbi:bifunctional DedA family/phosphatase PAP2 family protein [Halomonas campisalis]|uniref:Bifunctional DedA family/phosphatase PAP2 family protein n=1 Tax=Billgrantia campisalis TaxID=74661 RepID=A0ABS9P3N3_9GAMM|nr:bifunctional DedA family/phosphatase PAP2 family protein [Halomonas campisalis]MCG6656395.1 bifunctional DedA family/phosphatase PAP2 family protein [Halomonas campisalis]MDR5861581.1 bifunctional DedA family/phosphatase PAP2 family protein [Halomonas campisalis]